MRRSPQYFQFRAWFSQISRLWLTDTAFHSSTLLPLNFSNVSSSELVNPKALYDSLRLLSTMLRVLLNPIKSIYYFASSFRFAGFEIEVSFWAHLFFILQSSQILIIPDLLWLQGFYSQNLHLCKRLSLTFGLRHKCNNFIINLRDDKISEYFN